MTRIRIIIEADVSPSQAIQVKRHGFSITKLNNKMRMEVGNRLLDGAVGVHINDGQPQLGAYHGSDEKQSGTASRSGGD